MTKKVKEIITGSGINIPDDCIDRAHRIGKKQKKRVRDGNEVDDGVEVQPIIVRFISFRDRTTVYKKRKEIKSKFNLGISVDLTKRRLNRLNNARKVIEEAENDYVKFVYSDINCKLRAFTKDGKHLQFTPIDDLKEIIEYD